jgi:hypothetical protein
MSEKEWEWEKEEICEGFDHPGVWPGRVGMSEPHKHELNVALTGYTRNGAPCLTMQMLPHWTWPLPSSS